MSTARHTHAGPRRMLLVLPAALVAAALFGSPAVASTPAPTTALPAPTQTTLPTSQGIIMRDGGVCDPIRHMGC